VRQSAYDTTAIEMILRHDDHCWGWAVRGTVESTTSRTGSGDNCTVAGSFNIVAATIEMEAKLSKYHEAVARWVKEPNHLRLAYVVQGPGWWSARSPRPVGVWQKTLA
jgi:hypothetical protein